MSDPATIRQHLEAIRNRNAQWNNEECRDDYWDARAALELLDSDQERYFNLLSEHGTDEVFAFIYDPDPGAGAS